MKAAFILLAVLLLSAPVSAQTAPQRYAIVDIATGDVLNIVMLVPGAGDLASPGTKFVVAPPSAPAEPEGKWTGTAFAPAPADEP